jgi:hypothetical protein
MKCSSIQDDYIPYSRIDAIKNFYSACTSPAPWSRIRRRSVHTSVFERAIIGTWVVDEVRLAVQKEYHLTEVYEFYEYKITQ